MRYRTGLLFLLALVLLFFWKLTFTHLILARGDVFLYFYPYWEYRAQSLLAGELPLWNPYLFMGAPFLANPQAGVFYPLNWPLVFLAVPDAFKVSILLHVTLAAWGAWAFARRSLGQSPAAALLSAAVFALGGYLTAQAEHINQLQALAWFPWLLWITHRVVADEARPAWRVLPAAAAVMALMLLAGHTQSVFIALSGAALYGAVLRLGTARSPRALLGPLLFLAAAGSGAALLAAGQLLPTLELSRESLRSGGLPLREALSFSLDPRLVGRALLPGYTRLLFSEFVAYPGMAALALAALGLGRSPRRLALLALAVVGLGFALGAYNPLYALLAALPPVNLFRVPARWLFLFAFAVALLAGHGLDEVARGRSTRWMWLAPLGLLLLAPLSAGQTPAGETGPLPLPGPGDLLGWSLPLLGLGLLLRLRLPGGWRSPVIAALAALELFLAAQALPYNHLTTPEAYSSVRPAMTQLLADLDTLPTPATASGQIIVSTSSMVTTVVSGIRQPLSLSQFSAGRPRFLSLSALRFDPGDLGELRVEWEPQLPADAIYDLIVATKHKEVLSPNLPLAWRIPAVDGFDGGILPLRTYARFTSLFTGMPSPDGRLRENLSAVPDRRLLGLANVRYLITDKVKDAWVEDVFYDLQFMQTLEPGETAAVASMPRFTATALGVVMDEYSGSVRLGFEDGSQVDQPITGTRVRFPKAGTPVTITLVGPLSLRGLSLIDERSGAFLSLTLGPYRLAHSGDVKIYEQLDTLPRAFVAPEAQVISDDDALQRLAQAGFDPARTVLLAEAPPAPVPEGGAGGPAEILSYAPEQVRLRATGPGYLLLTDAYYPGWTARVDGQPVPLLRADVMFRAVPLTTGEHEVVFSYAPRSVKLGLAISALAWLGLAGLVITLRATYRGPQTTGYGR